MYDYVLTRFLLLTHHERCLKPPNHLQSSLTSMLPTIEFQNVDVTPNEFLSSEISVRNVGRFDIFVTADFQNYTGISGRLNIVFELKIDSKINAGQSRKYADWLFKNHPNDVNLLVYILPNLLNDAKTTVGDERWYCMDYQLLNDKLLLPILEHPNLNQKAMPFIVQYVANLRNRYRGIKMAITDEEKKLATELYEKYSDVFDSIFDALQEANITEYSTSDIALKGRKSGRLAVKVDNKIFEGDMVRTLFRDILKYFVDENIIEKIPLPWGVGKVRYIVTNEAEPKHPNGKDFFYPESYKGYTLETHYGRDRALKVLDSLCQKLEIDFEAIDV